MHRPVNATERLAARYIPAGFTVYREIPGAIVYSGIRSTPLKGDLPSAIAYRGTAMNSEWNYTFRSIVQLNEEVEKFFDQVKAHRDYMQTRKATRDKSETDTQKVKKALKLAGYAVTSVVRGTGTASNWIEIRIDDYDEYIDASGYKARRYSEVMQIAKEASGRSHLHDDIQTDYFCVNINVEFTKYHRCSECLISNCTEYHTPDSCARGCFYSQEMADADARHREESIIEEARVRECEMNQPKPIRTWNRGSMLITEEAI